MGWAVLLLSILGLYALIGVGFAAAFVFRGAAAVDPGAEDGPWGFRLLIFPGAAALWPVLLVKWMGASRDSSQRDGGDA